jgi:hypothetical protein
VGLRQFAEFRQQQTFQLVFADRIAAAVVLAPLLIASADIMTVAVISLRVVHAASAVSAVEEVGKQVHFALGFAERSPGKQVVHQLKLFAGDERRVAVLQKHPFLLRLTLALVASQRRDRRPLGDHVADVNRILQDQLHCAEMPVGRGVFAVLPLGRSLHFLVRQLVGDGLQADPLLVKIKDSPDNSWAFILTDDQRLADFVVSVGSEGAGIFAALGAGFLRHLDPIGCRLIHHRVHRQLALPARLVGIDVLRQGDESNAFFHQFRHDRVQFPDIPSKPTERLDQHNLKPFGTRVPDEPLEFFPPLEAGLAFAVGVEQDPAVFADVIVQSLLLIDDRRVLFFKHRRNPNICAYVHRFSPVSGDRGCSRIIPHDRTPLERLFSKAHKMEVRL